MGQYDTNYPAGPGAFPVYPDPTAIYTPVGSPVRPMAQPDVAPLPPAQAAAFSRPAANYPNAGSGVDATASSSVSGGPRPPEVTPLGFGNITRTGTNSYSNLPAGEQVTSIPAGGVGYIQSDKPGVVTGQRGSFSVVPASTITGGAPGGGVAADIARVSARLAHYEGQDTLTGMLMAKGMRTRLANLRALQVQQGQLGVQQREATVREETAFPQNQMAGLEFGMAAGSDPDKTNLRVISAARRGQADVTVLPNALGGANVVRNTDILNNGGAATSITGAPAPIGRPAFTPSAVPPGPIGRLSAPQYGDNDYATWLARQRLQNPYGPEPQAVAR